MSEKLEITLDTKGRILITDELQRRLGLSPGMTLSVEQGDDGSVMLQPRPRAPVIRNEGGVLVVDVEPLSDLAAFVEEYHERRVAELMEQAGW